jgi:hypothetical protein
MAIFDIAFTNTLPLPIIVTLPLLGGMGMKKHESSKDHSLND